MRLQELGAEVVIGDLLNLNDVRLALRGIRGAYLVYPLSPTLVQATAIFAQAAKEAEVEIVANMSPWNSRPSAKSPATINQWLSEQVWRSRRNGWSRNTRVRLPACAKAWRRCSR